MTKLNDLYDQQGQSPWLDNLRRDWLQDGKLADLVSEGIRGVTSNPTIFAKAISGQDTYDEEFKSLIATTSVEDAYWQMVIDDINNALRILRSVYDSSNGGDGFVSVEVAPSLAHDTDGTITAARDLHTKIDQPNLLVKIPGTLEGLPAIQTMISEGRSINVTLIFSVSRYDQVIDAYISGLEEYAASGAADLSSVASVASFFVSRVDTEVDRRIEAAAEAAGGDARALLDLRGKAAVAQARQAYRLFTQRFSGDRWEALAAKGARVQRPLWASTSTKNPAYPDLAYVDTLIGPDTVNTMPDETIERLPRPRHRGQDHRRRRRRRRPGDGRAGRRRDRHGGRRTHPRSRRGRLLLQVVRRVDPVSDRQSQRPHRMTPTNPRADEVDA